MTDREAYNVLECMAIDLTGGLAGLSSKDSMAGVIQRRIDAVNTAQVALQGREERSKRMQILFPRSRNEN